MGMMAAWRLPTCCRNFSRTVHVENRLGGEKPGPGGNFLVQVRQFLLQGSGISRSP